MPATFRHPAVLAKSVVTADHVSGAGSSWGSVPAGGSASTVGTVPEAVEQLQALEDAGLTRLMGQHLLHRDLDAIELMGREVIPALGSLD